VKRPPATPKAAAAPVEVADAVEIEN